MLRVFGLEPGGYLVTDESSLADFIGVEDMDMVGIRNKIQQIYEIDLSDTDSRNLVEIFARIHKAKYGRTMAGFGCIIRPIPISGKSWRRRPTPWPGGPCPYGRQQQR